jgi:HAD superfamily hydrolase (TIGR01549 family)
MTYDGLLLDHDGVIVTLGDRSALDRAARGALQDAGVANPDPDAVEALRIWVSNDDLDAVSSEYGLDPERLWRTRDDRLAEALRAEAREGRKAPYDDVDVLGEIDRPLGVVSNNQTRVIRFVLDYYDLADHVDTIRARSPTPESLPRKKPSPTYLEEAMRDLSIENPLYVGDSESDVVAGKRAGLDTAFLHRPHRDGYDLDVEPDYELDGLTALPSLLRDGAVETGSTW